MSARRADLQFTQQRLNRRSCAFDIQFNPAVLKISDPTDQAVANPHTDGKGTIPHALDTAPHDDLRANLRLSHRLSHPFGCNR